MKKNRASYLIIAVYAGLTWYGPDPKISRISDMEVSAFSFIVPEASPIFSGFLNSPEVPLIFYW